jgi:hypothetical protein
VRLIGGTLFLFQSTAPAFIASTVVRTGQLEGPQDKTSSLNGFTRMKANSLADLVKMASTLDPARGAIHLA